MTLEELQTIQPYLQETLDALKSKLGANYMGAGTRVFTISTKIETTRGEKKATWIVILDGFGNITVTRS